MKNSKSRSTKQQSKKLRLWVEGLLYLILAGGVSTVAAGAVVMYLCKDLPTGDSVVNYQSPVNTLIKDDKGKIIAQVKRGCYSSAIEESQVSEDIILTATLSEDARFKDLAVNPISLGRAFTSNILNGKTQQGGSGITAQFAKLYLEENTNRKGMQPLVKKVQDNFMALRFRTTYGWSWQKVMKEYLTVAASDKDVCGFRAYLQQYHKIDIGQETLQHGVMYISQLPNPVQFNPNTYPTASLAQYRLTINKIRANGKKYNLLTPEQDAAYAALYDTPLPKTYEPDFTKFDGSWAKSANTDELAETKVTKDYESTGQVYTSSIDSEFQKIAEDIVQGFGRNGRVIGDIGVSFVDATNMTLVATVGGQRPYALDYQLNRSYNTDAPTGSVAKVADTFVFLQNLFEADPNAGFDIVPLYPNWTNGPQGGSAALTPSMAASLNYVFISAVMDARETRQQGYDRFLAVMAKYPVVNKLDPTSYYSIKLGDVAKDLGVCDISISEIIQAHKNISLGVELPENLERTGVSKLTELWEKAGIKKSCTPGIGLFLKVQDHANALGSYNTNLLQSSTIMSLAGNGGYSIDRRGLGNSPITSFSKVVDRKGKIIFDANDYSQIQVVAPRVAAKVKEATRAVMGGTGRKGYISGAEDQGAKTGTHESNVINFTTWYVVNGRTYVLTVKMMNDDYSSFGNGIFSGDYVAPLAAQLGSAHVSYLKSKK
jgi:membrane peptidoglycan carboxypeptidase